MPVIQQTCTRTETVIINLCKRYTLIENFLTICVEEARPLPQAIYSFSTYTITFGSQLYCIISHLISQNVSYTSQYKCLFDYVRQKYVMQLSVSSAINLTANICGDLLTPFFLVFSLVQHYKQTHIFTLLTYLNIYYKKFSFSSILSLQITFSMRHDERFWTCQ